MEPQNCERCGEPLAAGKEYWLELDTRTSLYHEPYKREVPEEYSQGLFAFGPACARAVLANGGAVRTIGKRAPANRPKGK